MTAESARAGATLDSTDKANWESSATAWHHRPPLTPHRDDIAWFERIARKGGRRTTTRALLLGVTAGIATMRWPADTTLIAVDWSARMIETAWPRTGTPPGTCVVQADWMHMPLIEAAFDVALGDGCYTAVGSLASIVAMNRAVARVLAPGGIYGLRCFSRGEQRADVDELFDELLSGEQRDLGLFRWLLLMALQGDDPSGVVLDELWRVWHERVPAPAALAARYQWRDADLASIERYAGQYARYVYPTVEEMREAAAPDFDLLDCELPNYPAGEHFPRMTFVRRR